MPSDPHPCYGTLQIQGRNVILIFKDLTCGPLSMKWKEGQHFVSKDVSYPIPNIQVPSTVALSVAW
jgi:hypothetical protein